MRMRSLMSSVALAAATLAPVAVLEAPAEAASLSTWNRLAQCESSGRWHINTGNGYYGGLQISRPTWRAYGGGRFARYPHRATKLQQIKVAERIKRGQGWRAWPACSSRIGLR
jgi:resuscitation-promoting factor RpfA